MTLHTIYCIKSYINLCFRIAYVTPGTPTNIGSAMNVAKATNDTGYSIPAYLASQLGKACHMQLR